MLFSEDVISITERPRFDCVSCFCLSSAKLCWQSKIYFCNANSVINRQEDDRSETSSNMSQTFYDRSKPYFKNIESEIPDTVSTGTVGSESSAGGSQTPGSNQKSSNKGQGSIITVSLLPKQNLYWNCIKFI